MGDHVGAKRYPHRYQRAHTRVMDASLLVHDFLPTKVALGRPLHDFVDSSCRRGLLSPQAYRDVIAEWIPVAEEYETVKFALGHVHQLTGTKC